MTIAATRAASHRSRCDRILLGDSAGSRRCGGSKGEFARILHQNNGYTNGYTKPVSHSNFPGNTVAPTGIDPVTFRFSVERSTN